jgi:hypothetical protein
MKNVLIAFIDSVEKFMTSWKVPTRNLVIRRKRGTPSMSSVRRQLRQVRPAIGSIDRFRVTHYRNQFLKLQVHDYHFNHTWVVQVKDGKDFYEYYRQIIDQEADSPIHEWPEGRELLYFQ